MSCKLHCYFCCYITKSCLTLWPHGLQHARLLCPPLSPGICSNSCPLTQWCHLTISSSAGPFSICFQSFPGSGSFLMNLLFASGGQSIGASASAPVLPMNIQGWFPLKMIKMVNFMLRILCCCLVASYFQLFCNPMGCSQPGSSVRGIFQARILK